MRKIVKTGAAVLMLACMAENALAATAAGCAQPEDMTAVKTAAIQQRLMVAALSCHAVDAYNKFVTSYQKDLQSSDQALQNFFRRLNGKTGTADYHAFKTKLANAASMQSIGDITGYCASAQATFDTALSESKPNLKTFVSTQTTSVDDAFAPCQFRTAGVVKPTPPKAKPATSVIPAQGQGLATAK
ncbi:MAG TPA: hypothetical protein VEU06_00865 [Micropepsaceae bacterium]|jgi:hypothetical protein|nr:hypothetical protein [Micropepsaceae bacterium]